jgi:hypothetical protein
VANFYVASAAHGGSDAAAGSIIAPWATIAKVTGSTFSAGDSVSFNRGDVWREQLTVPSAGSAGNLITFGAYGSGVLPIVTGADLATAWTQDAVTPLSTSTFESGSPDAWWSSSLGAGGSDDTVVFKTGAHSRLFNSGTDNAKEWIGATNTNYAELTGWWRLDTASTATTGNKTRILKFEGSTWNGASGVTVVVDKSGAQYRLSISIGGATGTTFNIATNTWYFLRACVTANGGASTDHAELYVDGTVRSTLTGKSFTTPVNANMSFGAFANNASGFKINFDDVNVYASDSTVLPARWFATVTTQPKVVIVSRALGTLAGSAAAVSSAGQWFWGSNLLYVYSVADPGATAIEAAKRTGVVAYNAKDYIKLQNLQIEGCNDAVVAGIEVEHGSTGWQLDGVLSQFHNKSGAFFDSTGGIVTNSAFNYNGYIGIDFDSGAGMVGTDITAHHNVICGVYLGAIFPTANGCTFTRLACYSNVGHGFELDNANTTIVQDSQFYANGFNGIWVTNVGNVNGAIFRRNVIRHNGDCGLRVDASSNQNVSAQYNLMYGNVNQGLYFLGGSPTNTAYNNVLVGNGVGLQVSGASTAATIKNNVSQDNTTEVVISAGVGTVTLDYNDWFHTAGGNFLNWKGTASGFSAWKTNSSQDAHSISADPLFVSLVTPDFRLGPTSPAINAGVSVGLTSDYLGTPVPSGAAPDLGAYERVLAVVSETIDRLNAQRIDERAQSGAATQRPPLRESAAAQTLTWYPDGSHTTA